MKFLIDAQLPKRAVQWIQAAGFDAIHTADLPSGNRSSDFQIIDVAERENLVLVSKDADFVDSYTIYGRPKKLLLVSTGNIANLELERLMISLIRSIVREFETNTFIELSKTGIILRD